VAAQVIEKERKLIAVCRSGDFSIERLREAIRETNEGKSGSP
jgi:hypothetical protein